MTAEALGAADQALPGEVPGRHSERLAPGRDRGQSPGPRRRLQLGAARFSDHPRGRHPGLESLLLKLRGGHPEATSYQGAAKHLPDAWIAVPAAGLRAVLEHITIEQVASGEMPPAR